MPNCRSPIGSISPRTGPRIGRGGTRPCAGNDCSSDQARVHLRADQRGSTGGAARGMAPIDAGYGNDTTLRTGITALGLRYVAGIGPNQGLKQEIRERRPPRIDSPHGQPCGLTRRALSTVFRVQHSWRRLQGPWTGPLRRFVGSRPSARTPPRNPRTARKLITAGVPSCGEQPRVWPPRAPISRQGRRLRLRPTDPWHNLFRIYVRLIGNDCL